jgi:hypothetical protein
MQIEKVETKAKKLAMLLRGYITARSVWRFAVAENARIFLNLTVKKTKEGIYGGFYVQDCS